MSEFFTNILPNFFGYVLFAFLVVLVLILGYYWIKQIGYGIDPKRMVFVPTFLSHNTKQVILQTIAKYVPKPTLIQLWEPGCGLAGTSIWLQQQLDFKKVVGIEVDGLTMLGAQINKWLNKSKIELLQFDFFSATEEQKPSSGSLIYCYLGNTLMSLLYKSGYFDGCLVFSLTFPIEGLEPNETIKLSSVQKKLYVYDLRPKN